MSENPKASNITRLSRSVLTCTGLFGAMFAVTAGHAQPNEEPIPEATPAVEIVQVIGQRGQARSAADSAVPVDVLTALDLRSTGAMGNELGEALASITSSFSFPRQSNSVTSDHVRGARLRNLSPDQVLVLVNGKRRHPSAVVNDNTTFGKGSNAFDFNTIPLSAVKRVEILRDGASAQYGSDAIAGVINIVLKDAPEASELEVGSGVHLSHSPIKRGTVNDGETFFVTANHGFNLNQTGFVRIGGELRSRNPTNRAGLNRVPGFVAPPTLDNIAFRGQRTSRSGDPDSEEFRLWGNSSYELHDNVSLYVNGTWLKQQTEGAVLFRHPDSNQNVRALYRDGTLPVTTGDNQDIGLNAGVELGLAQWELDISAIHGRNRFDFGTANSLNPSLGADSPTRFHSGRFEFQQSGLQVDAYRNLIFRQMPVTVAAGTAYRREDFRSTAGDAASYIAGDFLYNRDVVLEDGSSIAMQELVGGPDIGAQGAKGLTPEDTADTDRHVYSAYVDVSSQLSERLFASAALRWEEYSDFGDKLTGKMSGNYRLTDLLAVRASASNSFRAPTLSQLGWSRSDNTFDRETFERISSRLIRADSPVGTALGVAPLTEEDARNYSIGFTLQASDQLLLTVDAFRIDIDDRIGISESLQGEALIATVQNLPGGEGVRSVSFFTNAIDTRTEGLELVADWNGVWGSGQYSINAAYSFIDTQIRRLKDASQRLRNIDPNAQLFESGARNVLTTASPRHKGVISGNWQTNNWHVLTRIRHYGTVERDRGFASQRFSPDSLIDIAITRQLSGSLSVTAGADNVFDRRVQRSSENLDFGGNFAYEVITPAGANGRFIYANARYIF